MPESEGRTTRRKRVARAYRLLFFDENGELKPEALTVIDDLCDNAKMFEAAPLELLQVAEGGRQMVRHILNRLRVSRAVLSGQIIKLAKESDYYE